MKNIVISGAVIALFFSACTASKQTTKPASASVATTRPVIDLNNGQKITVTTTGSSDADMGMAMQMKNTTAATNILHVISTSDSLYSITNTLTKMNMSMSVMGQESSYDSEKPEDKDSEIGKSISSKINQPDTLSVNKNTGSVVAGKEVSPERAEENPLVGIMGAMGMSAGANPAIDGAFYVLPKGRKTGDTWSDSTTVKNIKTVRKYMLKSIENGIATITVNTTVAGTGEAEMQGTAVSFTMNTQSTSNMLVNVKSSFVSKITTQADVAMTMDLMGQSMPVTSKLTSTTIYTY